MYDAVVTQARRPELYARQGVPDSVDGRFEMVVLHALLVMRRLRAFGARGEAASQSLFDLMFADFDRALRELGVGDLGVGRRIKKMAQAFYGRAARLDEALDEDDAGVLAAFLKRNAFGTVDPESREVAALADYVRAQARCLDRQTVASLTAGEIEFAADGRTDRGGDVERADADGPERP